MFQSTPLLAIETFFAYFFAPQEHEELPEALLGVSQFHLTMLCSNLEKHLDKVPLKFPNLLETSHCKYNVDSRDKYPFCKSLVVVPGRYKHATVDEKTRKNLDCLIPVMPIGRNSNDEVSFFLLQRTKVPRSLTVATCRRFDLSAEVS